MVTGDFPLLEERRWQISISCLVRGGLSSNFEFKLLITNSSVTLLLSSLGGRSLQPCSIRLLLLLYSSKSSYLLSLAYTRAAISSTSLLIEEIIPANSSSCTPWRSTDSATISAEAVLFLQLKWLTWYSSYLEEVSSNLFINWLICSEVILLDYFL